MITLLEYAKIADEVYTASRGTACSIDGFECVPGLAVDDDSVFRGGSLLSSGFQGRVFRKTSTKECVIAFKGTKPSMASDLAADLKIVCEAVPRQAYQAIAATEAWRGKLGGSKVTMTGHSLGGGIAQIVGITTGVRFVTFNAPGMWTNAIGVCAFKRLTNTLQRGMNMIKWGDPVGNFGKHIGDTTRVRSMGHSIVGFIDFLKTYPDRDKDPLA